MVAPERRSTAIVAATAAAVVVCTLAIVVWKAPANWLALQVAARTRGVVLLADARGTIWSGSAVMALGAPRSGADAADDATDALARNGRPTGTMTPQFALPGRISWTLGIDRSLAPVLHLTHDDHLLPEAVVARLRDGGVTLDPGQAVFPASLLRLAGAPLNTLMPDGRCELRWTALRLGPAGAPVGDGTMRIADLALAISPVRPLGDYRVAWSSGPTGVEWRLTTERGALDVGGAGSVVGRRTTVRVAVRIARDAPPAVAAQLNPLLDLLGRRGGSNEAILESGMRS